MPTPRANTWLLFSAVGDVALAALHVVIVFIGPQAYLYFGATSLADAAQRGASWPAVVTAVVALLLAVCGWYALAGVGLRSRPPLLRTVLVGVAALYLLRGLVIIPDVLRLIAGAGYPLRQLVFSGVALTLGITHSLGTIRLFNRATPSLSSAA